MPNAIFTKPVKSGIKAYSCEGKPYTMKLEEGAEGYVFVPIEDDNEFIPWTKTSVKNGTTSA